MSKIRVLIADDHAILRDGLCALLEREPDMTVIGQAGDGYEAVQLAARLKPDVVIMDISMPRLNGCEATRQIIQADPRIKVLALSCHDSEEYVRRSLTCGASGYILKESASGELLDAIRSAHRDEMVLSPAITRLVVEDYLRWGDVQPSSSQDLLSPREREVLQLIAEGYSNKDIAGILSISIKTVQSHRMSLMRKLDLHNSGELIKYAIQKKIIDV